MKRIFYTQLVAILLLVVWIVILLFITPACARAEVNKYAYLPPLLPEVPAEAWTVQFDYVEEADVTNDELLCDEDLIRMVISEADEIRIAQMLYGEDRDTGGPVDTMKQSAVVWVVFNRMAAWDQTVEEVITHDQFHGWHRGQLHPDWAHEIVRDVALRWSRELRGEEDVGRTLPVEYLFFSSGGRHEKFRSGYRTREYWDWSLPNPYE